MGNQRRVFLRAVPFLFLGLIQTSAFAQAVNETSTVVSTAMQPAHEQPSELMRYISPEHYATLLPQLANLSSDFSIAQGVDAVATSSGQLIDTLGEEFHMLGQTAIKAVTFETLSAALEAGLFVTFFGGSVATAGGIFVVSFVSSTAVYVAHEYAWEHLSPPNIPATAPERIASKAATYRALSILRTFAVGNILGGADEIAESVGFALSVAALDTALYGAVEYSFESLFASTDMSGQRANIP